MMDPEAADNLIDNIAAVYGLPDTLEALIDWCNEEAGMADCRHKDGGTWRKSAEVLAQAQRKLIRIHG